MNRETREYGYTDDEPTWAQRYLAEPVLDHLSSRGGIQRVLDLGCGNGSFSRLLVAAGYETWGLDKSVSAISFARGAVVRPQFRVGSVYDDLLGVLETEAFDAVVSLEVIEHIYDPRALVSRVKEALRPGGYFVLTTPYHGYLKNLALAASGRLDAHFNALWDGGHIKFWSRKTLSTLLEDCGFEVVGFRGAGRLPYLWKSMIVTARLP